MRNFNGKKRFGNRDFGGRDYGDRNFDGPEMFQTVCDGCGDECEVPFKPNGRKPVYCRSCFKKESGEEGVFERRDNRRDFDRPRYDERPRYEDKPRFEKPRYEKPQGGENYKAQFDMLNFKLDMIIKTLQKMGAPMASSAPVVEEAKETKAEKPAKVKKAKIAPEASEEETPPLAKPIKLKKKKA